MTDDNEWSENLEQLWTEEAVHRNAEIDAGTASMRDAEDVFRDARDRISGKRLRSLTPTEKIHYNKIKLL